MKQQYEYEQIVGWEILQERVKEGWRIQAVGTSVIGSDVYILERAIQDEGNDEAHAEEVREKKEMDPYTIGKVVGMIHNEIDYYFKMEMEPESFDGLSKKYTVIHALRDVAEKIIREM